MKQLTTKIDKQFLGRLCADAISELERAARLHPEWPSKLASDKASLFSSNAQILKAINDGKLSVSGIHPSAQTVFEEEYYEFMEAAMKPGNQVAARIELVQAMAMLLRISCHLNDYVAKGVQP